jgi:hypothetical protein
MTPAWSLHPYPHGKITIRGAIMQHIHKRIKVNSGNGAFIHFTNARAIIANTVGKNMPYSNSRSNLS